MVRMACVNIPSFSLQLLLHEEPGWMDFPVAVVNEEKPMGIILELNRKAKSAGIGTGMRFSAALAIEPELHAATVDEDIVSKGSAGILSSLLDCSPEVEPFPLNPGVFWINAAGFLKLFTDLDEWAESIQIRLEKEGFISRVSVGFTRFGSYLAAKRAKHPIIFQTIEEETRFARFTPLTLLPMSPRAAHQLKDLGVDTIGAFINLPSGGIRKRFPKDVDHWYRFAAEDGVHPVQPEEVRELYVLTKNFQPEIKNIQTVLIHCKELLDHLITDVMKHNELIHTVSIVVELESGDLMKESVSPSRPTVRPDTLYRLLTLRFNGMKILNPVRGIRLSAERVQQRGNQELLFQTQERRSRKDAAEAFSLIRAELGNNAVQYAYQKNEHLPENQFEWRNANPPFSASHISADAVVKNHLNMVRRIYLTSNDVDNPNHEKRRGGPFRITAAWWENDISRDYYYLQDIQGAYHWGYRDNKSNTWRFQGYVS
ncbi:MAG: DNA polymerase Y family protein [Deltaproteobacteria bacterium]|jgi:protein ImuB|nr:DNA polymerase Y family protein [Deltaproteobacteria bacterium]